jgi:hypothetical protein
LTQVQKDEPSFHLKPKGRNRMRRFSIALGCIAIAMSATQAPAMDYGDANVQPVSFLGWLGGDELGDCHGRNGCHGGQNGHGGKHCHDKGGCNDPLGCNGFSCSGFTPICSSCEPLWNVYLGAVILDRSPARGVPGIDYDWELGVDLDARRRLGNGYQLQVRYFGVNDWSDTISNANYNSNLHSTEVNLRRQWTESLTLLAGFRWVEMSDLAVDTTGNFLDTNNHMYGGQIGAEWLVWDRGGPFTLTTGVKAGIFYNRADYDGLLIGNAIQARTTHTAFLGEWDIIARYQLTDRWTLRTGYQLLWLEGVASVDADQVNTALNADPVSTSGSPFYHGVTIGAEFTF